MRPVLFLGASVVMLVGCGSSNSGDGSSGCTAASATATSSITMQGMQYSPTCARVPTGTAVVFTNDDSVAHTVTTDAGQAESFDSGSIAPGASYQHTFSTAGTIAIHCTFHSNMHLSVVVQ